MERFFTLERLDKNILSKMLIKCFQCLTSEWIRQRRLNSQFSLDTSGIRVKLINITSSNTTVRIVYRTTNHCKIIIISILSTKMIFVKIQTFFAAIRLEEWNKKHEIISLWIKIISKELFPVNDTILNLLRIYPLDIHSCIAFPRNSQRNMG